MWLIVQWILELDLTARPHNIGSSSMLSSTPHRGEITNPPKIKALPALRKLPHCVVTL